MDYPLIRAKIDQIRKDIVGLENRDRILANFGGAPIALDVQFQKDRLEVLERMLLEGEVASKRRLLVLEKALGPASGLKYGSMRGVPPDIVKLISFVELLELGLGIHPTLENS